MHKKPFKNISEQITHLNEKGIKITDYFKTFDLLNSKLYCSSITPYKLTLNIKKGVNGKHIYNDFTDEITNIFRNTYTR